MKYLLSLITLLILNMGFSQSNEMDLFTQISTSQEWDGDIPSVVFNVKIDMYDEFELTKKLLSENIFEGDDEKLSKSILDKINQSTSESYKSDLSTITYISDNIFIILTSDMKSFEDEYVVLKGIKNDIEGGKDVKSNFNSLNNHLSDHVTKIKKEQSSSFRFKLIMYLIFFSTISMLVFIYFKKRSEKKKEILERENNYQTKTKWNTTTKLSDEGQKELNRYMNIFKGSSDTGPK
ncbi:MAG: hypothetical protein SLAVMIC_00013 [uncultured marine phage]|uniref:Uncharacterized protein n=1 Tax=uncultured marine phage TaxID=707152 RepID=A0A8D9C878_9VIRU|nr:MAG: hypothetical protein SLAVMIC_00013 [uncultured marine phage]